MARVRLHRPTGVPSLHEHEPAFSMDSIRHFPPGRGVVIGDHDGRARPLAARPVDENALGDYKSRAVASTVCIVFDLCWTRLEVVDAAVPRQSAHDDAVPKGELRTTTADSDGL